MGKPDVKRDASSSAKRYVLVSTKLLIIKIVVFIHSKTIQLPSSTTLGDLLSFSRQFTRQYLLLIASCRFVASDAFEWVSIIQAAVAKLLLVGI